MNLVEVFVNKESEELKDGLLKTVIVSENGLYQKQNSWLGHSVSKINSLTNLIIPGLEKSAETVVLKDINAVKIPAKALIHVMKWYKDITDASGKEAQVNFYRKQGKDTITVDGEVKKLEDIIGMTFWNDEIFSYTPKQRNSGALTEVDNDPVYDALNSQYGMYVETHSHNSMAAFKSGTDAANSGNDAIQLVFGKFSTNEVEMFSWATVRGLQYDGLTVSELEYYLELPDYLRWSADRKLYYDQETIFENIDETIFEDWNSQVKKNVSSSYNHAYSGYSNPNSTIFATQGRKQPTYNYGYKPATSSFKTMRVRLNEAAVEAVEVFMNIYTIAQEYETVEAFAKAIAYGGSLTTYSIKGHDELVQFILEGLEEILIDPNEWIDEETQSVYDEYNAESNRQFNQSYFYEKNDQEYWNEFE